MFRFIMNIIRFRVGQKATKKMARGVGLKWLSKPLGLLGGFKSTR